MSVHSGFVISFMKDKKYGFIKDNESDKSVFFHTNDLINKDDIDRLDEDVLLRYEIKPTEKGYAAYNISVEDEENMKYIFPEDVVTTKEYSFKDLKIIQVENWVINAHGKGNPDDVLEDLKEKAYSLGANGIIGLTYQQTTGSESSDSGHGTHYYTVHNFYGVPVVVGKPSINGEKINEDFSLDENIQEIWERNKKKNKMALFYKVMWWVVFIIPAAAYLYFYTFPSNMHELFIKNKEPDYILPALLIIVGYILQERFSYGDYNYWLANGKDYQTKS